MLESHRQACPQSIDILAPTRLCPADDLPAFHLSIYVLATEYYLCLLTRQHTGIPLLGYLSLASQSSLPVRPALKTRLAGRVSRLSRASFLLAASVRRVGRRRAERRIGTRGSSHSFQPPSQLLRSVFNIPSASSSTYPLSHQSRGEGRTHYDASRYRCLQWTSLG